jgi:hypothetical protein
VIFRNWVIFIISLGTECYVIFRNEGTRFSSEISHTRTDLTA